MLVSQGAPLVEVFRKEGDLWVLREHGPGDEIELASLGVAIAVDRLYADPTRP